MGSLIVYLDEFEDLISCVILQAIREAVEFGETIVFHVVFLRSLVLLDNFG